MSNSTSALDGEYLCLHIGQAGINIGNKCWELYCLEHNLHKDGTVIKTNDDNNNVFNNDKKNAFFKLQSNNRYYSRAIFIDFESDIIDTIRESSKHFYRPDQFICGRESAGNCFASGFYCYDPTFNESVLERIRYELEQCDNRINGIQIMNSMCGGTGSGYTSHLLNELHDCYDQKLIIQQLSLIPSINGCGTGSIDIYNTILSLYYNLLYSGLTVLFDNEALYNVYDMNYLSNVVVMGNQPDIVRCTKKQSLIGYNEINNILTHAITKLTSTLRFQSTINETMYAQQLNLQIPNQSDRLHFPIISYAPIVGQRLNKFSTNNHTTLSTITNACFYSDNQLLKLKRNNYKMLNGCIVYACDKNYNQNGLDKSLFKKTYPQFKRGFVDQNLKTLPNDLITLSNRTALLLGNSLNIIDIWSLILSKYRHMMKHKAFVHWYVNHGMELDQFEEAYLSLKQLHTEYSQIIRNQS